VNEITPETIQTKIPAKISNGQCTHKITLEIHISIAKIQNT
jgi:hypothetical protein